MPRPVHLAGQRLRRRPDKCDAGCRRHKLHITHFRRCRRRKLAHSAAPPSSRRNPAKRFRREEGGDKNSRVIFFTFLCGGITYPPVAVAVSEQPGAGFISAEKTAFSEWVLCADGHAVPSCTQCFFGVPVWGWYHYPRRALHAAETLDAQGTRWLICRFYAATVLALCGQNIPTAGYNATPAPNRAHSGSQGETRGVLVV